MPMHNPFETNDANSAQLFRLLNNISAINRAISSKTTENYAIAMHKKRKLARKIRVLMTSKANVGRIASNVENAPLAGDVYSIEDNDDVFVLLLKEQHNKQWRVNIIAKNKGPMFKTNFDIQINYDLVVQAWNTISIDPDQLRVREGTLNTKTMDRARDLKIHFLMTDDIPLVDNKSDKSRAKKYMEYYNVVARTLAVDPS